MRVRIAGILEQGGRFDYTLFLSLKETEDLNAWATGERSNTGLQGYDTVYVQVSSVEQVDRIEDQINQSGFTAYSIQSQLRQLNLLFSAIQAVLGAVGGVALLVAGFGIANAMIMAIYERTREIGLMKAVGARNREIMAIFLTEAGLIGMFGGIAGAAIGWLLGKGVGLIAQAYLRSVISQADTGGTAIPNLIYTPLWLILFAVGFSALVGVISGLYPALRAPCGSIHPGVKIRINPGLPTLAGNPGEFVRFLSRHSRQLKTLRYLNYAVLQTRRNRREGGEESLQGIQILSTTQAIGPFG